MLYKFTAESVLESDKAWSRTAVEWKNSRHNKAICTSIHDVSLHSTGKRKERSKMPFGSGETEQILQESGDKNKVLEEERINWVRDGNGWNIIIPKHNIENKAE